MGAALASGVPYEELLQSAPPRMAFPLPRRQYKQQAANRSAPSSGIRISTLYLPRSFQVASEPVLETAAHGRWSACFQPRTLFDDEMASGDLIRR
jgi:hypothetical protein